MDDENQWARGEASTPEGRAKILEEIEEFVPESEAQRHFVEIHKRWLLNPTDPTITSEQADRLAEQLCMRGEVSPEVLGEAAMALMRLAGERDALIKKLGEILDPQQRRARY
jgi:hypothetical protein